MVNLGELWRICLQVRQDIRDAERAAGACDDPAGAAYLRGRAAALVEVGDLLYDLIVGIDDVLAGEVWRTMLEAGEVDE